MEIYDGKKEFIKLYIKNGFDKEKIEKSSSLLWAAYCKSKNAIDVDVSAWAINLYLNKYSYLKNSKQRNQDKAGRKFEIVKDGIVYRGDTMTSFSNFIRRYFILAEKLRNIGQDSCADKIIAGSKVSPKIEKFASLAHSAGNLIPVPLCFNIERSGEYADCDYWDIVMYYIFKWCYTCDDKYIFELLNRYNKNNHVAESIWRFKKWMENFDNNWFKFVNLNYLDAFVDQQSKSWYPKEFWVNHFAFNRKIEELSSVELDKAIDLICNCIEVRNNNLFK